MSTSVESVLEINVGLQPKQDELFRIIEESPCTTIGTGGRRGGGKSGGLRRIMLIRRLKYPNTDGILLRRTRQELLDNHLTPMFREWPFVRDWWVAQDKALVLPNGSRLLFRYAEHEGDVDKLFGVEYADVAPEEAGLFSQRELEKMKGSNRWPGVSPIKPCTIMSFMPAGRSHFYLKRIFVDGDYIASEDPKDFAFVETWGWDNVEHCRKQLSALGQTEKDFYSWPEEVRKEMFLNSDYGRKLLSITDTALRAAWLDGSWSTFEGLIFTELNEKDHNLDNWMPNFRGMDAWHREFEGIGCKMISAVDWADSGQTGAEQSAIDEHENMFFFDEYAARHKTVLEHTANITAMLNSHGRQEYTLMDLPVNNINQENLFSIQDAFCRAGLKTIQAHRSNIAIGFDLLKQMLKIHPLRIHPFTKKLGSPRFFASKSRCPQLWKQMKEIQQEVDVETGKVKYIGEDDNLDPARYIAMSRPNAPTVPIRVAVDRVLAGYAASRGVEVEDLDPNSQHMITRRAMIAEQKSRRKRRGGVGRIWRPQN